MNTDEYEQYLRHLDRQLGKKSFFHKRIQYLLATQARFVPGYDVVGGLSLLSAFEQGANVVVPLGVLLEKTRCTLQEITSEIEDTRNHVNNVVQKIRQTAKAVNADLVKHSGIVREEHSSALASVGASVSVHRDIRKFFLDSDYTREMQSLTAFIGLSAMLDKLTAAGILESVLPGTVDR